jgi:hypothetical protein
VNPTSRSSLFGASSYALAYRERGGVGDGTPRLADAWMQTTAAPVRGDRVVRPEPRDAAASEPDVSRKLGRQPGEIAPTLFDQPGRELGPVTSPARPEGATAGSGAGAATAAAVLASKAYTAQRRIARRVALSDEQVSGLLKALLAAPAHRLGPTRAAIALAVSPIQLRGAVLHAQQLLNVDGYAVLMHDPDGVTVVLDEPLLREQFGVSP